MEKGQKHIIKQFTTFECMFEYFLQNKENFVKLLETHVPTVRADLAHNITFIVFSYKLRNIIEN